jgi:hypothetical protein
VSNVVIYTTNTQIANELGLTTDNNGNYYLWQVPTAPSVVDNFVTQANQFTTALFGDLSTDLTLFPLAQMFASKWAALRLVEQLAINWQVSGLRSNLGNIGIDRLPALTAAATAVTTRLKEDLNRLYMTLVNVNEGIINSWQPGSPYIVTGGSAFWW